MIIIIMTIILILISIIMIIMIMPLLVLGEERAEPAKHSHTSITIHGVLRISSMCIGTST